MGDNICRLFRHLGLADDRRRFRANRQIGQTQGRQLEFLRQSADFC